MTRKTSEPFYRDPIFPTHSPFCKGICFVLPFCRLYIGSKDRPCFHGRAELKKSSCVQMFLLDLPGSFMIPQHHLNLETRCQIPPVLTSPMEPLGILPALSCTVLFQWRCIFFHHSLVSICFQNVSILFAKKRYGLATCKN